MCAKMNSTQSKLLFYRSSQIKIDKMWTITRNCQCFKYTKQHNKNYN